MIDAVELLKKYLRHIYYMTSSTLTSDWQLAFTQLATKMTEEEVAALRQVELLAFEGEPPPSPTGEEREGEDWKNR